MGQINTRCCLSFHEPYLVVEREIRLRHAVGCALAQ
jgi:hypothetical protein